jgi:signal transduction histidine kinase
MGIAAFLGLVTPIVALYTGLFHASIWWRRRSQREHMWFALMAFGVTGFAAFAPEMWVPQSVAEGRVLQSIQLSFAGLLLLGFARFTVFYLSLHRPLALRLTTGFAIVFGLGGFAGQIYFADAEVVRRFPFMGLDYIEAQMSPLGAIASGGLVGLFLYWVAPYARSRHRNDPAVRPLLAPSFLWLSFGINDFLVSLGLYDAPYLLVYGYVALVVGISVVLVRRFVDTMDEVERLAGNLHGLVEARTAELRQKDLQLAQGEKMAAIGTLAAGIAHEINNPMAFVTSNLNRLEELWTKPDDAEDVEAILAECREGTARVRAIVSNLLQVARRGEGRSERVDLCSVVRTVLPIVQHEARYRAELRAELAPVPTVTGDAGLLGQVVLNLVLNALQAIGEGAPSRNRVVISTRDAGGSVQLRVEDTGCGIPADVLPKIFDPFFTTKESGKGTGLGLAISYQIVSQHGGRIDVESTRTGSRFTVELPATAA